VLLGSGSGHRDSYRFQERLVIRVFAPPLLMIIDRATVNNFNTNLQVKYRHTLIISPAGCVFAKPSELLYD
jgi:hypothetical protein